MAPPPNRILRLELVLPSDSTPEEREETILHLRRELLETDVLAVENAPGAQPPAGAKGFAPGLDALLITLAGSGSLLGSVVTTLGNWLTEGISAARHLNWTATKSQLRIHPPKISEN